MPGFYTNQIWNTLWQSHMFCGYIRQFNFKPHTAKRLLVASAKGGFEFFFVFFSQGRAHYMSSKLGELVPEAIRHRYDVVRLQIPASQQVGREAIAPPLAATHQVSMSVPALDPP